MAVKIFGTLLAVSLVALVPSAAHAQQDLNSANAILPGCRAHLQSPTAGNKIYDAGLCMGVIIGIAQLSTRWAAPRWPRSAGRTAAHNTLTIKTDSAESYKKIRCNPGNAG